MNNEVAIFGKPGSIAKFDLTENKSIWVGELESKYIPYSISQYQTYILVFSYSKWGFAKAMIHCFEEATGNMLWSGLAKNLIANGFPFYPHVLGDCIFFMSSPKEIAKLNLQTGKLLFKKTFNKSIFSSYGMIIISDQVYLLSKKDAKIVDKISGSVETCNKKAGFTCALATRLPCELGRSTDSNVVREPSWCPATRNHQELKC